MYPTRYFPATLPLEHPGLGDETELRRGRLIDAAVRAALLTDADVRVIDASTVPALAEHIGALCRFPAP